jgi:hypothetical protein
VELLFNPGLAFLIKKGARVGAPADKPGQQQGCKLLLSGDMVGPTWWRSGALNLPLPGFLFFSKNQKLRLLYESLSFPLNRLAQGRTLTLRYHRPRFCEIAYKPIFYLVLLAHFFTIGCRHGVR